MRFLKLTSAFNSSSHYGG